MELHETVSKLKGNKSDISEIHISKHFLYLSDDYVLFGKVIPEILNIILIS